MQIDPRISIWLNLAALVLGAFAGAGWWADLVGQHTATIITGVMTTVVAAINIILHAYSAPVAGPAVR